jgi:hypothetical protein
MENSAWCTAATHSIRVVYECVWCSLCRLLSLCLSLPPYMSLTFSASRHSFPPPLRSSSQVNHTYIRSLGKMEATLLHCQSNTLPPLNDDDLLAYTRVLPHENEERLLFYGVRLSRHEEAPAPCFGEMGVDRAPDVWISFLADTLPLSDEEVHWLSPDSGEDVDEDQIVPLKPPHSATSTAVRWPSPAFTSVSSTSPPTRSHSPSSSSSSRSSSTSVSPSRRLPASVNRPAPTLSGKSRSFAGSSEPSRIPRPRKSKSSVKMLSTQRML